MSTPAPPTVPTRRARPRVSRLADAVRPGVMKLRRTVIRTLERRARITTTGEISPEELGFSPEARCCYMASSWTTLARILRRSEVSRDDVFIDFGSGKGRVLYQAAMRYPFRRIEGVELSPELTAIAQANLDASRDRFRCKDVRLVTCDVTEYEIPDDLTIAYLYNPFRGHVFQALVDHLVQSVQRHPRRLRLIYLNPLEGQRLLDAGFKEVRRLRGLRRDSSEARARMYELTPGTVNRPAAPYP